MGIGPLFPLEGGRLVSRPKSEELEFFNLVNFILAPGGDPLGPLGGHSHCFNHVKLWSAKCRVFGVLLKGVKPNGLNPVFRLGGGGGGDSAAFVGKFALDLDQAPASSKGIFLDQLVFWFALAVAARASCLDL